jgi:hypothetical protein
MTDRSKNRFGDKTCRISRRYVLTGGTCRGRNGMNWQGSCGRYGERIARVMPALSGGMWTTVATRDEQANLTHTIDGQSNVVG